MGLGFLCLILNQTNTTLISKNQNIKHTNFKWTFIFLYKRATGLYYEEAHQLQTLTTHSLLPETCLSSWSLFPSLLNTVLPTKYGFYYNQLNKTNSGIWNSHLPNFGLGTWNNEFIKFPRSHLNSYMNIEHLYAIIKVVNTAILVRML